MSLDETVYFHSHESLPPTTQQPLRLLQANALLESTFEGVMITDDQLRILDVNPAFTAVTGFSAAEAIGQTPRLLRSGRHERDFYDTMWQALQSTGRWRGEIWNRRKNGELYPELLTISALRDASGRVTQYVAVFADVSVLRASEARLEFLSRHDPLTGLANRQLFDTALHQALVLHRSDGRLQPALLLIDLTRFNAINQSFGHALGDEVLERIAKRLHHVVREHDLVARLAGDEFAVLVSHVDTLPGAGLLAQRLLDAVQHPLRLGNDEEVIVHASIGIAVTPFHGTEPGDLMRCASGALAAAKQETPRGGFRLYSHGLTSAARERLALEGRLRRALEQCELDVHYQPQVDVASGRIVGAEALARWTDEELGHITPDRFIPLAEEAGLIGQLGELVLATACRQWVAWGANNTGLRLAVNCSALQLRDEAAADRLLAVVRESGLAPQLLELEVTEGMVMQQSPATLAAQARLRGAGIRLAVDDFGTGYSSLAYLRTLHLDTLKIDRQFLGNVPGSAPDNAILRAIIELAHSVGCQVVAEGVEEPAQLAFLQQHACNFYQGWLFSKALPAEAFGQLIQSEVQGD